MIQSDLYSDIKLTKNVDAKKGYGFITPESGADVFVHFSAIKSPGFKTLAEGENVKFNVITDAKGSKAVDVEKA